MGLTKTIWAKPAEFIAHQQPQHPVMFFAPGVLQDVARRFIDGFPGFVSYAVKANPMEVVIENLATAGLRGFHVGSVTEMRMIRRLAPDAVIHYNNPVRARAEILAAAAMAVKSFAVDSRSELAKLIELLPASGIEVSVRFRLPTAAPDDKARAKFGADPALAAELLIAVAAAGFTPSLSFHTGTQCTEASEWVRHILAAAEIAAQAGVQIARLNVGGGFPGHRLNGVKPDLKGIFAAIAETTQSAFGAAAPRLVCEPGRGMVAECFTLGTCVRALRDDEHVFLNDGTYGSLDELPLVGLTDRIEVLSPEGRPKTAAPRPRVLFGPTCDPVDRLPGEVPLAGDLAEGDHLLFHGLGAYSTATNTRFNGFGDVAVETVLALR
ncbi:type III PLP-dependent enzyme domain-containing protein [Falsigemmobacter faecalis]|uniref:ornithine decarboxylase n=1 Tax=Falsigemmobacter faecalis TaxID=2488730 RepID=A0A3P3DSQ2_9RHOB|nr:type III PLP-dependent enzyme [Falsigemmobacter faecalis]RRH76974.1 type III PLP-dependent enzyme [Falsigemmobacter faecalis]